MPSFMAQIVAALMCPTSNESSGSTADSAMNVKLLAEFGVLDQSLRISNHRSNAKEA